MTTSDWLAIAVQVLSLLVVGTGIIVASHRATESQDSSVVIELGREYRQKWESGGRAALTALENGRADDVAAEEIRSLLNWIDWLGVAINHRVLRRPELVLDTVGPSMGRVLASSWRQISADVEVHGPDHWSGALHVAELLEERIGWAPPGHP